MVALETDRWLIYFNWFFENIKRDLKVKVFLEIVIDSRIGVSFARSMGGSRTAEI